MNKKKTLSIIFIIAGIILPIFILPLSSEYYPKGNFFWNIIRNAVTGEIVIRDSIFEVVPDRDDKLYKEFNEYRQGHPESTTLSEEEIIERFYQDRYMDKMHGMELRLKLQKQQVVTHRSKVIIPYRYVIISGVVLILTGAGILTISKIRNWRKKRR
jgi:hypothetical protein